MTVDVWEDGDVLRYEGSLESALDQHIMYLEREPGDVRDAVTVTARVHGGRWRRYSVRVEHVRTLTVERSTVCDDPTVTP